MNILKNQKILNSINFYLICWNLILNAFICLLLIILTIIFMLFSKGTLVLTLNVENIFFKKNNIFKEVIFYVKPALVTNKLIISEFTILLLLFFLNIIFYLGKFNIYNRFFSKFVLLRLGSSFIMVLLVCFQITFILIINILIYIIWVQLNKIQLDKIPLFLWFTGFYINIDYFIIMDDRIFLNNINYEVEYCLSLFNNIHKIFLYRNNIPVNYELYISSSDKIRVIYYFLYIYLPDNNLDNISNNNYYIYEELAFFIMHMLRWHYNSYYIPNYSIDIEILNDTLTGKLYYNIIKKAYYIELG